VDVFVHDPYANAEEAFHEYGVTQLAWDDLPRADAIVAAVSHGQFASLAVEDFQKKLIKGGCIMDVKSNLQAMEFEQAGMTVWRL
jgi:UDP-N-acetyl-D-galactosamine dehydrogenase